jgi:hypothetical protein
MIEVLKQALKAFEVASTPLAKDRQEVLEAVKAIKQAIAELESQEPVAHCTVRPLRGDESYPKTEILWVKGKPIAGPLYTHPPQRTEQLKACVYCGQLVAKENT